MEISLLTDIGQKRSNNQDFVNKYKNKAGVPLIVLADGMGGHRAGNIASELAVTNLGKAWVETEFTQLIFIRDWLIEHIEIENQTVHALGQEDDYKGMGTTIEAAAIVDNNLIFAHVGDSRIGIVRDGLYTQLTSDHSLVNELVKAGELTEEEAAVHPQKNIITQSIGQASPVDIDLGVQPLMGGDTVLINSDGLTNMVSQETIETIINDPEVSLAQKAQVLVDTANTAGGLDNISVALVAIDQEDNG